MLERHVQTTNEERQVDEDRDAQSIVFDAEGADSSDVESESDACESDADESDPNDPDGSDPDETYVDADDDD
jgi:hypothetical protein